MKRSTIERASTIEEVINTLERYQHEQGKAFVENIGNCKDLVYFTEIFEYHMYSGYRCKDATGKTREWRIGVWLS